MIEISSQPNLCNIKSKADPILLGRCGLVVINSNTLWDANGRPRVALAGAIVVIPVN